MKKLLIAICMVLGFVGVSVAQTAAPSTTTTTTKTAKTTKTQKATKPVAASGLKADGTPDMRLKANKTKTTAPVTGPTKKDGTADMRYKSNKKKKDSIK